MAARCRIGCVRIGRFAIGALRSAPTGDPSAKRASSALVAVAELNGKAQVVATSRAARSRGVAPGMALAEAAALAADLVALRWDQERVARAALDVTTALLAASPRVSWAGAGWRWPSGPLATGRGGAGEGGGIWWIDAAGLGDETKLARHCVAIARGLRYGPARAGIADSAIAAYAATCNGRTDAPTHGRTAWRVVPSGADAEFLTPFPITLLDLDDDLAATLRTLGLTTLGALAALHPDEVEARFGPEGLAAHRLAHGLDSRGPTTPRDDALPVIEVELGGPVATAEPLLFVLRGALASLGEALRARGLAARELGLRLRLDDGGAAERAVRPARPTSHADVLFDHCRAALETWQLPEPATGLVLSAAVTVPAAGEQGNLLAPRWADPAALAAAFDRIRGHEGADAVAVPDTRDGHLPEDGGVWIAGRDAGAAPRASALAPPREPATALRRLPAPESVHVRLGRSGLAAFRRGERWHDVADWCGPERLAPRWWRGTDGARDYYTARTADGTLWLLYRAGGGEWFLEGWLD